MKIIVTPGGEVRAVDTQAIDLGRLGVAVKRRASHVEPCSAALRAVFRLIEVKPSAAEALEKIPQTHRRRIARKIDGLADNPRPRGAEKLAGKQSLYRARVGDWRIIYQIQDDRLPVLVVRIGGRGDVYRHLP